MSKINPYSRYSDFNQAWLGELPSHWQVMRTKLLFDLVTEFAPVGNLEELLSVYTAIGVKPRKELEARGNKASSTDNYWRVHKGDIIVNKLLAWMGAIGISEYNGVTSPAYDILRPKENVNPYYYNFLFRNPIASREFKRHSRGIMDMRLRLYFTRFGDIKLPLPPIEEQVKIVEYLQFKLKKIDRFIKKKKQLIKLLNEQKAAIINNAVTKGLDPKAKMKPSGIEWLGEIPEHWMLWKLSHSYKMFGSGTTPSSGNDTYFKNGSIPWVNTGDLNDGYLYDCQKYITEEAYLNYSVLKKYPKGTLCVAMYGATIGKISILEFEATTNQACCNFSESDVLIDKYTFYWFLGNRPHIISLGYGGGQPNISQSLIKTLRISTPPKAEQIRIIEYLENEEKIINNTVATIEKEIALTQEYRTVLIAEAVTGKIDVRNFVIPEKKEEEIYEELEEELSLVDEDEEI